MRNFFRSKKAKFLLGGLIVFAVIGYLVYAGIRDTRVYYMTPKEILNMGDEAFGKGLRLGGTVKNGSVDWNAKDLLLTFQVEDGTAAIQVVYQGVVPDTFGNGVEVVVEGTYESRGIFRATKLLAKCPSKYESKSSA